jgi:hypothetical protein
MENNKDSKEMAAAVIRKLNLDIFEVNQNMLNGVLDEHTKLSKYVREAFERYLVGAVPWMIDTDFQSMFTCYLRTHIPDMGDEPDLRYALYMNWITPADMDDVVALRNVLNSIFDFEHYIKRSEEPSDARNMARMAQLVIMFIHITNDSVLLACLIELSFMISGRCDNKSVPRGLDELIKMLSPRWPEWQNGTFKIEKIEGYDLHTDDEPFYDFWHSLFNSIIELHPLKSREV